MVTYLLTFIPQSRDAIASKNNLIFRILERFRGQLNKSKVWKILCKVIEEASNIKYKSIKKQKFYFLYI